MEIAKKKLIAIVDDEPDILKLVSVNLKNAGYKTKTFLNANSFFDFLRNKEPALIILDLMLPDLDGIEVCKSLKSNKQYASIPIIMLTAKADESDKIVGLELGADDYITKPFSPKELVARVKVVLRRQISNDEKILRIGNMLELDLNRYEVYAEGKNVKLTATEFKILKLLAARKGWAFSRESILDHIDIGDKGVLDRTVDVHIKNLRAHLGAAGKYIKNIRTVGYKIDDEI